MKYTIAVVLWTALILTSWVFSTSGADSKASLASFRLTRHRLARLVDPAYERRQARAKSNWWERLTEGERQEQEREEENDPDLPEMAIGKINKAEYLALRSEHIARLRGIEPGKPFDPTWRIKAIQQMEEQEAALRARNYRIELGFSHLGIEPMIGGAWNPIGPAPIPNGQVEGMNPNPVPVSGRVTAIAIDPNNPNKVYVGTAQGGVYRTTDGGTSWTPIFDNAQSLSIGALTIDPVTTTTLWVGTGEPNGSIDSYAGVGIYRIKNADSSSPTLEGPFETRTGSMATTHAFLYTSISKIIINPNNSNQMIVGNTVGIAGIGGQFPPAFSANGAFVGLYFSSNAQSNSPTWVRVTTLPGGGNAGTTDIVVDPSNPDSMIVGVSDFATNSPNSGIWVSSNAFSGGGSSTWTRTLDLSGLQRTVHFAINKVTNVVTVLAATDESATGCDNTNRAGVLRRSTDGGATWSNPIQTAGGFCGSQCSYDSPVAIDPNNANKIYLGGNVTGTCSRILAKSTDGGTTFTNISGGLHADSHAIAIAPSNTLIIYTGNDGGIFKSTDEGATWTSLNNNDFSATQFQSVAIHPTDANFTIGGTQDNGTPLRGSGGTWTRADFGDGGYSLIDRNATDTTNVTMYHTYFNLTNQLIGFARVTKTSCATDNGWSFRGGPNSTNSACEGGGTASPNGIGLTDAVNFYAPMALGPGNPNTVYFGTDRLYRSTDRGDTMTVVSQSPLVAGIPISAIGISPQSDSVRIVGLNNGKVFATTTGSSTLTDITAGLPSGYVSRAVISPSNQNTAYVTFANYNVTGGNIWRTTNLSASPVTWSSASGTGMNTLPNVPVNAFVIDPLNSNQLYAGTDIGVYFSPDGGSSWFPYGTGLPRVAVFDIGITPGRKLRIATHGRGMWQTDMIAPTAALVSVSGRVTTAEGEGISKAKVFMTNTEGKEWFVRTDSSGHYRIDGIPSGETYVFNVSHKRYSFLPQVVLVVGDMNDLNFTAQPKP
jgi:photosystem II stability/assembly factor-like uncharacterized protein